MAHLGEGRELYEPAFAMVQNHCYQAFVDRRELNEKLVT
jgi:hypothetical protein